MEFVAERLRRKFVALVYAGSNPVKLPFLDVVFNGSIRGLGPCGVSSNLAIQTKKAPSLASKPMKESLILYEDQNGSESVLHFLQDFPSPGIVSVLLVCKKSDGLLYQFAVIS